MNKYITRVCKANFFLGMMSYTLLLLVHNIPLHFCFTLLHALLRCIIGWLLEHILLFQAFKLSLNPWNI